MKKQKVAPTREQELVTLTREEGVLARKCTRLRRQLKNAKGDLKLVRAQRKGLQAALELERHGPDVMPSHLTNGATGHKVPRNRDRAQWEEERARVANLPKDTPLCTMCWEKAVPETGDICADCSATWGGKKDAANFVESL